MHQLSLGKRQGKSGFTESSSGTQLTDKHQKQEHTWNPFLSQEWNAFFQLGFTDFKPPLQDLDAYFKKKKAAIFHGDVTSAHFCSSAVSAQGTQSSCLTRGTHCLPFSNNPLGIILGLGLFQLSCLSPFPWCLGILLGSSGHRVSNFSALECSLQYLMSEVFREFSKQWLRRILRITGLHLPTVYPILFLYWEPRSSPKLMEFFT